MITGGMIAFEDGTKKAEDYAPAKKARVELKFDIDPTSSDPNAEIDAVKAVVMAKVYEMLGTAAPAPAKTTRGKKTDEAPAAVVETSAKDAAKHAYAQAQQPAQTAAKPEPDAASMDEFNVPGAAEDDLTTAPAEPVSDADLNAAVQAKNKELKDPPAIRAVIARFNPDPSKSFTLAELPQEQRRKFLAQLAELKAA